MIPYRTWSPPQSSRRHWPADIPLFNTPPQPTPGDISEIHLALNQMHHENISKSCSLYHHVTLWLSRYSLSSFLKKKCQNNTIYVIYCGQCEIIGSHVKLINPHYKMFLKFSNSLSNFQSLQSSLPKQNWIPGVQKIIINCNFDMKPNELLSRVKRNGIVYEIPQVFQSKSNQMMRQLHTGTQCISPSQFCLL